MTLSGNPLHTVVFADIAGSTALFEAVGNERATAAVTQLTDWIGETVTSHGGRVVKTLGDGVLGVFEDGASGVAAMAAMMRSVINGKRINMPARRAPVMGALSSCIVASNILFLRVPASAMWTLSCPPGVLKPHS